MGPALPEAELDIMVCLWKHGPQTVGALRQMLAASRPMTHASVSTLLARLTQKGFVTREKGNVGKALVFRAGVGPSPIRRRMVGELLDRVFGGSGVALVSTLLASRRPTAAELDELADVVEQVRQRRSASKNRRPDRRKERGQS